MVCYSVMFLPATFPPDATLELYESSTLAAENATTVDPQNSNLTIWVIGCHLKMMVGELPFLWAFPGPAKDRFLFSGFVPLFSGSKAKKRNRSFGGPGCF